ncbi:MAG: ABC transporter permease [Candidatus Binatia bacterium]
MERTLQASLAERLPPLRVPVSPLLPFALAPMVGLMATVGVFVWVSTQKGLLGTPEATYSLDNYRVLLGDPFVYKVLRNTGIFGVITTLVALAVGLPIAWITERTTIRAKTLIYGFMTTGLLVPAIFVGMGWTFIAHPRIGFLNKGLVSLFGLQGGPVDIGTPAGMGFVQGLGLAPLAFVLTVQVFRAMDPALEEAARTAGMNFVSTLRRVTLPLARPGILAALIYIFVIGIATFDIPAVIGLSNNVYVFSTYVYVEAFPPDGTPEYGIPAALGTMMVLVALVLTLWYVQVLRRSQRYQVITGKGYRAKQINLGRWVIACWSFIGLYVFVALVLPILLVAFMAFLPYIAPPSADAVRLLTLINFQQLNWEYVLRGLRNTLTLMAVVPPLILLLAFCTSWLVVRSRSRARYVLEFGAFLPHTIPRVVFALGALLLALYVVQDIVPIYGTIWIIAAVYVIVWLPFATRATNSSLIQIHKELEEAAYVSGLSTIRTARRVVIPLLRPTLLSVWIWTALLVYREVTAAVFLISQDNVTLPAIVWGRWIQGAPNSAAVITVLMMVLFVPFLVLCWRYARRSGLAAEL